MYQKRYSEKVLCLYLGDYSKKLYLREISRLSGIPLRTAQSALEMLENEHIMKSVLSGKNKYFSLNLENIETKSMLLQAEIFQTMKFLKKYPVFKSFLKELQNASAPIIIFGSFAKFAADKNSDTDLVIVSDRKIGLPYHLLPSRVHEISLSEEEFIKSFEAGEALMKKIEETHITLNNYSFLVNLMWRKYAK